MMKAQSTVQIRTTISFPSDLYETLEEIAGKKKVSLAWVVRDAAEGYVADQAAKGKGGEKASFRATGKATRILVEIAVAVHRNMRFLLLDEPTASQRYRASGLNPVIATITLWNTVYLERAAEALARSRAVDYCRAKLSQS